MIYLDWIGVILLSFGLGVLFLNFLTSHPLTMNLYLFSSMVTFFILVIILASSFRGWELVAAISSTIPCFLGGYAFSTRILLDREDTRDVPAITRQPGDPGNGHDAVIYFAHGEPETYDPIGWINQFKEFDKQDIPFVPFLIRPLFIYQLRNHYLRVGSSHHRQIHHSMVKSLEEAYRCEGDETTQFYISFLDDEPRPDAAVIQALNQGASRIIVAEVFLTISNHTEEGRELIEDLGVEKYGATISFTGPLWDSQILRDMFVQRADANIGDLDKSKVGILLVGHGQPDEWDQEWPTETQQEICFREGILEVLSQNGYSKENMSLAWMEFKNPKPAEKVEEFYANGVDKVLYFSAAISADSIHSQYDVPVLVNKADIPDWLPLINLGAWNNDPLVISAIKEKIDRLK